jgi:threonyl-tRNA synthetase
MFNVTFQNGTIKEFTNDISVHDAILAIDPNLAQTALVAKVDGVQKDLTYIISEDTALDVITFDTEEKGVYTGRKVYWHTASHIMAQAVSRLFTGVKYAIGPSVDTGFYYDFDTEIPFTMDDLPKIEAAMNEIIKEDLPLKRFTLPREEAIRFMQDREDPYKLELINDLPDESEISFYEQGEFVDLCAGNHLLSTGKIGAVKLISIAGAYWRGNEKNKMLTRIYGVAFPSQAELDAHMEALEEAKKRDHNKIGRELQYFTTVDCIGQGLPILMPKGAKLFQILQRFVEDEEERRGYLITKTPYMAKRDMYKLSGHWDKYFEGMFLIGGGKEDANDESKDIYALRPMTCPFQFQIYLNRMRSYRDLPLRYNETSTLFRNESSGEMHGLIRVRQFTISEGHLACRPDQLEKEFYDCIDLARFLIKKIGLDENIRYRFSKWDPEKSEKYIGTPEQWETVQTIMKDILDRIGLPYFEADGEAAFYGPKLDFEIRNVHGKEDTLVTIQIDFLLAERYGMEYVDSDGTKKYPYVIHRTSIGCYERTIALLLEKYAGALPVWLSPVQVIILPISEKFIDYAEQVSKRLAAENIRVEMDYSDEKIGYKIRKARNEKVPYMLIVGEKEKESGTVSVRSREKDEGAVVLEEFIGRLQKEANS